jgi:hypothetical protein
MFIAYIYQQGLNSQRPFTNQPYLPNGAGASGPVPGATPLLPNQGRVSQIGGARLLCIADVRGELEVDSESSVV